MVISLGLAFPMSPTSFEKVSQYRLRVATQDDAIFRAPREKSLRLSFRTKKSRSVSRKIALSARSRPYKIALTAHSVSGALCSPVIRAAPFSTFLPSNCPNSAWLRAN